MKSLLLATGSLVVATYTLFANGGAWQSGVPGTGTASASNKSQKTDVTIDNEMLKIDLHPEYADVTVRYRMHNTGPKVQQDFFFPVERWGKIQTADTDRESDDIDHYQSSVDGKELKSTNVAGAKEESSETKEETSESEPRKQRSGGRRRRNDFGAVLATRRVHDQVMEEIRHSLRAKSDARRDDSLQCALRRERRVGLR